MSGKVKVPAIDTSWYNVLKPVFESDLMASLRTFLRTEKAAGKTIYPPGNEIFNAYNLTPLNKVRCVIIGQDPYHGVGQAHAR